MRGPLLHYECAPLPLGMSHTVRCHLWGGLRILWEGFELLHRRCKLLRGVQGQVSMRNGVCLNLQTSLDLPQQSSLRNAAFFLICSSSTVSFYKCLSSLYNTELSVKVVHLIVFQQLDFRNRFRGRKGYWTWLKIKWSTLSKVVLCRIKLNTFTFETTMDNVISL